MKNIGIAISQFWNAVFRGSPDETVSSRLGKLARTGHGGARFACWLIGLVLGQRHCAESIEEDEGS